MRNDLGFCTMQFFFMFFEEIIRNPGIVQDILRISDVFSPSKRNCGPAARDLPAIDELRIPIVAPTVNN